MVSGVKGDPLTAHILLKNRIQVDSRRSSVAKYGAIGVCGILIEQMRRPSRWPI